MYSKILSDTNRVLVPVEEVVDTGEGEKDTADSKSDEVEVLDSWNIFRCPSSPAVGGGEKRNWSPFY